jgi:hypothetical protein
MKSESATRKPRSFGTTLRSLRMLAVSILSLVAANTPVQAAAPTNYFKMNLLPPTNGMYISPQSWHAYYASGVIISNVAHRIFTQGILPPIPGAPQTHNFSSTIELQISMDTGLTWQPVVITNAGVTVQVGWNSTVGNEWIYTNNMRALSASGSGLPAGVKIRQSTMSPSLGQTHIWPTPGGYWISSFFDVYTELSIDNGLTWAPASSPARMELRPDPALIAFVAAPRTVLPMPNGQYISPTAWHQLYASGIVIRDIRHKLFTGWVEPPTTRAASLTHTFDSQLDFQLSTDGGAHFTAARAPATMTVGITNSRSFMDRSTYQTEVTQLDIAGGDLPAGVRIRESPTKVSRGGTSSLAGGGGGGAGGGAAISSFFDIFTEVSTDGGSSWGAATNGPAHMELQRIAPVNSFSNNLLPALAGQYNSPQQWHAYYANGIVLTNVVHRGFTAALTPPLPGLSASHTFGSTLEFDVSYDGGLTYSHTTAPATVSVQITCRAGDDGITEYYDTEMTQLSIAGGGLPANIQIRESPTRASLGRTTASAVSGGAGGYGTDSFFDIFTEVTTDGGVTWLPSVAGPATVTLGMLSGSPPGIVCPTNITVGTEDPGGAVVSYPTPTTTGGCSAITLTCVPPSGSTFPLGTNTVTCTASDACGQHTNCSFTITVVGQSRGRFYQQNLLPPTNGIYLPAYGTSLYWEFFTVKHFALRLLSSGVPPPPPSGSVTHSVGLQAEMEIQFSGSPPYDVQCAPPVDSAQIRTSSAGVEGGEAIYQEEVLQLNIAGGALPNGVQFRQSPTVPSLGQTRIRSIPGGYLISSYLDLHLEITYNNGGTWSTESGLRVELSPDPQLIALSAAPNVYLPMPNGQYVTPAGWRQLYPNGIAIKDIRHKLFSSWAEPPSSSLTETFALQTDFQFSTDGGLHFTSVRAPATMTLTVNHDRDFEGWSTYDTKVAQLDIAGGDLPAGVQLHQSVSQPSKGGISTWGTAMSGFFDIFAEVSTDSGLTWTAATNGPAHLELQRIGPTGTFSDGLLPPLGGRYLSLSQGHADYANGILLTNLAAGSWTPRITPPLLGLTTNATFSSVAEFDVSYDGGLTYSHATAPATVGVQITCNPIRAALTMYYDTEIAQLSITGGGLQPGVQIRESPTRASLGRTTMTGYQVDSFFDLFTEVSTDGGLTWHPSVAGPTTVTLSPGLLLGIVCPSNITVDTTNASGTVVTYEVTTSGGCLPITTICLPPSGSTFPIGTTSVSCTTTDACAQEASCTFNVTVRAQLAPVTITRIVPAQGGYSITYTNGSGSQFVLLTAPTITAPMNTWTPVKTNAVTPGFFFVAPTTRVFYRIQSR